MGESLVRQVLWAMCRMMLKFTDGAYNIVSSVFKLNLSNFSWIWKVYWVLCAAIGLFITARIVTMIVRSYYDDSLGTKIHGIDVLNRVISVLLIISLIPVVLPLLSTAVSAATDAVMSEQSSLPSDLIIEAGNADGNVITLEEGQHYIDVITTKTINNKSIGPVGEYQYIPDMENILLITLLGGISVYCYLMIAIQIVQRLVGLIMKIFIAPYAVSGLVDPADQSTSMWVRLCLSDFLVAFFQLVMVRLVLEICSSLPGSITGLAKGIVFLGASIAVVVAPSGIAQLLGGDVGAQTAMQSMQTLIAAKNATDTSKRMALAMGTKAVMATTGLTAAGTYGIGRVMGGKSLNPNKFNGGGPGASGGSGSASGGAMNPGSAAFNAPPTDKQMKAAQALGIPGAENMSRGELSLALEEYGAGRSYFGEGGSNGENLREGSAGYDPSLTPEQNGEVSSIRAGLTRGGTLAGRLADFNSSNGRMIGRMTNAMASHMYSAAAKRIFDHRSYSRTGRVASFYQNLTQTDNTLRRSNSLQQFQQSTQNSINDALKGSQTKDMF